MDIFSFLIGLILGLIGLSMTRILWTFRGMLCCVTSYYLLKIVFPNTYIWNINEYTVENVKYFFASKAAMYSSISMAFSFLLFYWIIPLVISNVLNNTISKVFQSLYDKFTQTDLRLIKYVIHKMYRFIFKIIFKISPYKPERKADETDDFSYNEFMNIMILSFSTLIHLITCILLVSDFYVSGIIIISFYLFIVICSPMMLHFRFTINKALRHEFNRAIR